jgi:glycine/D-amino acid oxidase-like deaminating enzyme
LFFSLVPLRFLHPLSPRGRLAHLGLEGLDATGRLVREAVRHGEGRSAEAAATTSRIVLRDEIYRVAASERQARALRETAEGDANLSRLAEWIPSYGAFGALRLHSGCQVLHVPSYLKGLWRACQAKCSSGDANAREANFGRSARWVTVRSSGEVFRGELFEPYDAVVFAAGAGMLASEGDSAASPLLASTGRLPAQLVGGQSLVMALPDGDDAATEPLLRDAILCGKYVSPLPEPGLVLVGATHEFQPTPWTADRVFEELRDRTAGCLWPPELASALWDRGRVRTVTRGVRVQTARGEHGRLPIVGRLDCPPDRSPHPNAWLFTGLSSRGLLYHAWYGDKLARAVLSGSEDALRAEPTDLLWWRSRGDALVRAPSGNAE